MFTGLVEEVGAVAEIRVTGTHARLVVEADLATRDPRPGESIAVNGVCLTLVEARGARLAFDAVPETMARTNLGDLRRGAPVNLERALAVGQRLGGHFVQGHVDGTALLRKLERKENARILSLEPPPQLLRHIVPKGSVALDGISLTVVDVDSSRFTVWIVPHTLDHTNLADRQVGDRLNLETDVLAKYVEKLVGTGRAGLSLEQLEAAGFHSP